MHRLALRINPDSVANWLIFSSILERFGRYSEAEETATVTLQRLPPFPRWGRLARFLGKRALLVRASSLAHLGRYDEALRDIDVVLQIDPLCETALVLGLGLLLRMGHYEDVVRLVKKTRQTIEGTLHEKDPLIVSLLSIAAGTGLHMLKRYKEAVQEFSACLERWENAYHCLCKRAISLARMGDMKQALTDLKEASNKAPRKEKWIVELTSIIIHKLVEQQQQFQNSYEPTEFLQHDRVPPGFSKILSDALTLPTKEEPEIQESRGASIQKLENIWREIVKSHIDELTELGMLLPYDPCIDSLFQEAGLRIKLAPFPCHGKKDVSTPDHAVADDEFMEASDLRVHQEKGVPRPAVALMVAIPIAALSILIVVALWAWSTDHAGGKCSHPVIDHAFVFRIALDPNQQSSVRISAIRILVEKGDKNDIRKLLPILKEKPAQKEVLTTYLKAVEVKFRMGSLPKNVFAEVLRYGEKNAPVDVREYCAELAKTYGISLNAEE